MQDDNLIEKLSCEHDKGDRWYRKTNMFNESFCLKMDEISSCPFCEEDEDIKKEDSVMSRIRELETNLDIALKTGEAYKKEALKLKDDVLILKKALKFYASFESDENGFGGVDGEGRYVIRLSGYYVLDKGKTAQNALKNLGGNHGA